MTNTNTNPTPSLAELQKLLANFSAADIKKALKVAEANKPTLLSLTMDAIVAAGIAGAVVTNDVASVVTAKAREHGVIKPDESAQQSSVGSLIRYANAYDSALKRAGLEIVKSAAVEEPAGETPTGETGEQPAPEPVSAPDAKPAASSNSNRRHAA